MSQNNKYYYCNVDGNTDVGCRRKANEDWYGHFECRNGLVAVVCDGMGGHVGGAVASHLAVDTIKDFLEQKYFDDPRDAIVESCNAANAALLRRTQEQPELSGMGATCVMLIVRDGKVYIACVGDSRIYLIRSKTITQLTKDQSYVQMLVDAHEITKEQAEHHPRKNEILNAIGLDNMQPATVLNDPINPEAGDIFMLCSDGLSGMVSDKEILKIASNQVGMTQRERIDTLIEKARKYGGLDNITCLMVEFAVTPQSGGANAISNNGKLLRYGIPALVGMLLLGLCGYALWKHFKSKNVIKESLYVAQMKQQEGVSVLEFNDTIRYARGHSSIELKDFKDLGAHVYVTDKNGRIDTIVINKPIKVSEVKIMPDSNFATNISSINGLRSFIFNDKTFESEDISLTFSYKDSTFVYVFPVEPLQKISDLANGAHTDVPPAVNESPRRHNPFSTFLFIPTLKARETPKPKAGASETPSGAKEPTAISPEESLEATFKVGNEGETLLKLISDDKRPTDTEAYTSFAIKAGEVKGEWYEYSCDGHTCKIKVNNAAVPEKGAVIRIPLANAGDKVFIIRVKRG